MHSSVLTVGVRTWRVSNLCFSMGFSRTVRLRQLAAIRKQMKITVHLWSNNCLPLWRAHTETSDKTTLARGFDKGSIRAPKRKLMQKGMGKARVAAARKLGIRLWIMLRDQVNYEEFCRRGRLRQEGEAHAGMPAFNSGPALQ